MQKQPQNDRDYRSFKIHYPNACLSARPPPALTVSIVREEGGTSDAGPKYECTTYARTYVRTGHGVATFKTTNWIAMIRSGLNEMA